jgi:hypothetical protein
MHATCPTLLTLLDLIILITSFEQCKLWGCSLCYILHLPVTSFSSIICSLIPSIYVLLFVWENIQQHSLQNVSNARTIREWKNMTIMKYVGFISVITWSSKFSEIILVLCRCKNKFQTVITENHGEWAAATVCYVVVTSLNVERHHLQQLFAHYGSNSDFTNKFFIHEQIVTLYPLQNVFLFLHNNQFHFSPNNDKDYGKFGFQFT